MDDLWRLPAAELASLIPQQESFGEQRPLWRRSSASMR